MQRSKWPKYNVGRIEHLHALGVIAINYAAFERSMEELFEHHINLQKVPYELTKQYFLSLNEARQLDSIKGAFKQYEKDPAVRGVVENLIEYFQWCRDTRNQILHAEEYPTLFGGDPDTLYLTKRLGKKSQKQGYMAFKVRRLRDIADKIREGVVQRAKLQIYLRRRDTSPYEWSVSLKLSGPEPLPGKLFVPRPLKLSPKPRTVPLYVGPRGSFVGKSKS